MQTFASFVEYGNNLDQDIYSETSGHFRDALINLAQVLYIVFDCRFIN